MTCSIPHAAHLRDDFDRIEVADDGTVIGILDPECRCGSHDCMYCRGYRFEPEWTYDVYRCRCGAACDSTIDYGDDAPTCDACVKDDEEAA